MRLLGTQFDEVAQIIALLYIYVIYITKSICLPKMLTFLTNLLYNIICNRGDSSIIHVSNHTQITNLMINMKISSDVECSRKVLRQVYDWQVSLMCHVITM